MEAVAKNKSPRHRREKPTIVKCVTYDIPCTFNVSHLVLEVLMIVTISKYRYLITKIFSSALPPSKTQLLTRAICRGIIIVKYNENNETLDLLYTKKTDFAELYGKLGIIVDN